MYEHDDYPPRDPDDPATYGLDGTCETCGRDLDDDPDGGHDAWHSQCWRCWRGEDDDDPEPGR